MKRNRIAALAAVLLLGLFTLLHSSPTSSRSADVGSTVPPECDIQPTPPQCYLPGTITALSATVGTVLATPTVSSNTPTPTPTPPATDVATTPGPLSGMRVPAPFLAPPQDSDYTTQVCPCGPIVPDPGQPLAQLIPPPPQYSQTIAVFFNTAPTFGPGEIGFAILSAIKYEGSGHTVLVTLSELSEAAVQQGAEYGDQSVQLPDGTPAQAQGDMDAGDGLSVNQVVFPRGSYMITVAADLPLDQVIALAGTVVDSFTGPPPPQS